MVAPEEVLVVCALALTANPSTIKQARLAIIGFNKWMVVVISFKLNGKYVVRVSELPSHYADVD